MHTSKGSEGITGGQNTIGVSTIVKSIGERPGAEETFGETTVPRKKCYKGVKWSTYVVKADGDGRS